MMCRRNLITWLLIFSVLVGMVSVQALAAETVQARIDAQQIVLDEDLTMRFLATISDPSAVMKISVAGEEVGSYPVVDMTPDENGYYVFSTDLAAAQMTDTVNLELSSGGNVLLSKDYSVQQYADALLAGDYSDEIKAMVRQMLTYGAAAQTYFGHNTQNVAAPDTAAETVAIPKTAETEMVADGIVDGIAFYGASLVFRSKVAVRFYFDAPNGVEGYTFTVGEQTCEAKAKDELYYVEVPSISPADYSNPINLTVADASSSLKVCYSPMNYLVNMNNKEATGDSLKALLLAMYNYHLAAVDYTDGDSSVEYPYHPAFTTNYASGYFIGNKSDVVLDMLVYATEDVAENAVIEVNVENLSGDASAVYTAADNIANWGSGILQFSGTGEVKITINGTEVVLTVENTSINAPYQHVYPQFTALYSSDYYIGNVIVALGDLFSTGEEIGENAVINVEVAGAAEYTPADSVMNWANGTVTFTGTGAATVTVNGTALALTVENTSLDAPYQHVYPAFTANYGEGYYIGNATVSLGDLFSTTAEIGENAVINVAVDGTAVYNAASSVMAWASGTVTFSGTGAVTVTVNGTALTLTVENNDQAVPYLPAVEFGVKFENTDKYLYRVGNGNTVALGSLFTLTGGDPTTGAIEVAVEAVDGTAVSGTYTANSSDWTKSTLQFTGTGVVKVTINDTVLLLEVVNAVNATSAASAKSNNVVLLNDVTFSTIEVSNGYTLYGNGFTMTAPNDVLCTSVGEGFVVLNNGVLDNVQIICPDFSYSVVYTSNMTAGDNYKEGEWYGNTRSAVMADGNSTIKNSYIHGGRAVLYVRSGNIVVDNSTISGGAAANIHAVSAKSLTLRDVTMIQEPHQATVHDTSKTIMGLSGLFECDSTGACTPLILEGTLVQHAWIDESDSQYVPSDLSGVVDVALSKTDYLHDLDGNGTKESLNLGFTYVPQNIGDYITPNITDNRTDKATIPYEQVSISSLAQAVVYSYKNSNGTADAFIPGKDDVYAPGEQGASAPAISFADTNEDRVFTNVFNKTDAANGYWHATLTVNLDAGNYSFSFANLLATKFGKNLSYTVKAADGTAVNTAQAISLTESGVRDYVLTIADNQIYNAAGVLSGETAYHTYHFTLTSTKSSIPEPETVNTTGGTPLLVVASKNGDWSCAIPALEGITIRYYSSVSAYTDLNLATLTPTSTGKANGTNNFWETSKDGYSLKVTSGYIHEGKQVYGMPVVVNNGGNKMYFTISSDSGMVTTGTSGRTVTLTYEFTDPNGKTLTFSKTWQFNYADYKNGTQYSYSSFVGGTLKEASSGCFTPDTLITLADGTQKRVDELSFGDKILAWDFFTGSYVEKNISLLVNHGADEYDVTYTKYSDGSELKLIVDHGVFDYDLNKFVYITPENVADYVGHRFVKQNLNGEYDIVTMTEGHAVKEYTEAWSVSSAVTSNVFASGLLTVAPPEDFYNWIEMDGKLHYDVEQFQKDVETYGLYTYDDFKDYVTYEQFVDWNGAYLKIPVEKGYFTFEYILELIELYKGWMPQN